MHILNTSQIHNVWEPVISGQFTYFFGFLPRTIFIGEKSEKHLLLKISASTKLRSWDKFGNFSQDSTFRRVEKNCFHRSRLEYLNKTISCMTSMSLTVWNVNIKLTFQTVLHKLTFYKSEMLLIQCSFY